MAVLVAAVRVLALHVPVAARPHPVKIVFQPAEETGLGADRMVEDGVLDPADREGRDTRRIGGKVVGMYACVR